MIYHNFMSFRSSYVMYLSWGSFIPVFRMPTYTPPAPSRIPNWCILLPTRHLHLDASCPKWTSPSSSTNLLVLLYFLCISASRSPLTHLSKPGNWAPLSLTLPHHVLYWFYQFFAWIYSVFSLSIRFVTVLSILPVLLQPQKWSSFLSSHFPLIYSLLWSWN